MKRLHRLTAMILFLQSRNYTNIHQLVDKFEVSERTIYRDLNALTEAGLPLSFEEGRGYFIVDGYNLPPLNFTDEEANSIIIAEKLMKKYADDKILTTFSNAVEKIRVILNSLQKQKLENLEQHIRMYIPEGEESTMYLNEINTAVMAKQVVEIEYTNNINRKTLRNIEPIGLTFYGNTWHVIAYCHNRRSYRDFVLKRISKLRVTSLAPQDNQLSLDDYIATLPKM